MFEFVVGDDGFVFDPRFVSIDGIDGVLEDAGDLFVLVDPHADQGENSEIGVEELVVFLLDLIFFAEQIVEALDEVGKEFEENLVEIAKEIFLFFFGIGAVNQGDDVVPSAIGDLLFECFFKFFDLLE